MYHAFRLAQNASDAVLPQTALLFSVSPAFANLLKNSDGVLRKDWIDIMLKIINKAFQSGHEAKDLMHDLSYTLLHDATAEFLTTVLQSVFIYSSL